MTNATQSLECESRDRPDDEITKEMISAGQEALWASDIALDYSGDIVRWIFEAMQRARFESHREVAKET